MRPVAKRLRKSVLKRQAVVEKKERDLRERRARHLAQARSEARPVMAPDETATGGGTNNNVTWATRKRRRS